MALFYWSNYLVIHPKVLAKKDSILGEPGKNHKVFIDKMLIAKITCETETLKNNQSKGIDRQK